MYNYENVNLKVCIERNCILFVVQFVKYYYFMSIVWVKFDLNFFKWNGSMIRIKVIVRLDRWID